MSEFDVTIDPNALDVEWLNQPERMLDASEALATAKGVLQSKELDKDILVAEKTIDIGKNFKDYGYEKAPTVAICAALVQTDKEVITASKKVLKAKKEIGQLQAGVNSLDPLYPVTSPKKWSRISRNGRLVEK